MIDGNKAEVIKRQNKGNIADFLALKCIGARSCSPHSCKEQQFYKWYSHLNKFNLFWQYKFVFYLMQLYWETQLGYITIQEKEINWMHMWLSPKIIRPSVHWSRKTSYKSQRWLTVTLCFCMQFSPLWYNASSNSMCKIRMRNLPAVVPPSTPTSLSVRKYCNYMTNFLNIIIHSQECCCLGFSMCNAWVESMVNHRLGFLMW